MEEITSDLRLGEEDLDLERDEADDELEDDELELDLLLSADLPRLSISESEESEE